MCLMIAKLGTINNEEGRGQEKMVKLKVGMKFGNISASHSLYLLVLVLAPELYLLKHPLSRRGCSST